MRRMRRGDDFEGVAIATATFQNVMRRSSPRTLANENYASGFSRGTAKNLARASGVRGLLNK